MVWGAAAASAYRSVTTGRTPFELCGLPHNPHVSETPVPISSGSVPAGVPAWLSVDATEWVRLRPASWARPLWSVLVLLSTVVWAMAMEPDPPCSEAAPCGPDWVGMVAVGLVMGLLYWLVRLPELALIAAPALAVFMAGSELTGAGPTPLAPNAAVIAALCFGFAAARERLTFRRRQRQLAQRAAGVRHPLPQPVGPLRRGMIPTAAGLLLCVVAAVAIAQGLAGTRADEHHADRATSTTGKVVDQGEESVQVRTDDGRRIRLGSAYPEDYDIGGTVTVLEDGTWRRLVAEPYDAFGWQVLTLAAALPGLSLLTVGVLARRRAAALRSVPVPALRVLERTDHHGRTWIYAADDTSARTPLFSCSCAPVAPEGIALTEAERSALGDKEFPFGESPFVDTRLHEAVLFGSPHDGGELVLLTAFDDAHPIVLRTDGPVRLPRPGRRPFLDPAASDPASDTAPSMPADLVDRIAATLTPADRPLRWGPGPVSRAGGLALTAGALAATGYFAHSLAAEGFGWDIIPLLGVLMSTGLVGALLNWRVIADSTGLWLTGAFTVRHVPWDRLRAVRYTEEGGLDVHLTDGSTWPLPGLGAPKIERRLRLRPPYVRMTEEVTALHTRPELRPTEQSRPRDHGLPLGPALLVLFGLAAAASFMFL